MEIHSALVYACSQDPDVLKVGQQQLKAWEKEKGYYGGLASVFGDHNVDANVRWMAIICLKNGIDQYWRPTAPNAINGEEKQLIRRILIECIEEPEKRIISQLATLIAKIARFDCPSQWPELLTILTEKVRSDSPLIQRCSLLILKEVIKAFSSWRISEHRVLFFEITNSLFAYILQVWLSHLTSVSSSISQGAIAVATNSLSLVCICLKILQLMLLHGFSRFNADADAVSFINYLFELAPETLNLRYQLPADHDSREAAEKTVTLVIKTIFKLHRHHPLGFVNFIKLSFELVYSTVFNPEKKDQLYPDFTIYGLNLMKEIIKCDDYAIHALSGGSNASVSVPPQVIEAQRIKSEFFQRERVEVILNQLITRFMILTNEDLVKWQESPEDYYVSDEAPGQMYTFTLKKSVEELMMAIVSDMNNAAAPILVNMLSVVESTGPSNEWSDILIKESVYHAIGLCAFELYQHFDFDAGFGSHLFKELSVTDPRYCIVRSRAVWLLGCWVGVKIDESHRPIVYQHLIPRLRSNEDMFIRLTAVDSLKQVFEDIGFDAEVFSPFIPDATQLLLQLLIQSENSETKLLVMNAFSQLIDRVGGFIQPYIASLLEQIPHLWAETSRYNSTLLQCAIIGTMSHVVKSLQTLSTQLHPFLIHIIQQATDIRQQGHLYLAEDGLELWMEVLHHTPQPTPDLLLLLSNMNGLLGLTTPTDDSTQSMEGLMDIGSSSLIMCFNIIDAYTILCTHSPDLYIQSCSEITAKACQTYIRDVKQTGVEAIVNVLDRVMVAFPSHSHRMLQPVLVQLLHCVLSGEETYAPTLCLYLVILARAILCNAQHFVMLLQMLVGQLQQEVNVLLGQLLDVWAYRLDNIGDIKRRKLFGLAAASLLSVNDMCVLGRFGGLLDMCVDVLHDVTDVSTTGGQVDTLVVKNFDESLPENSPHKPPPSLNTQHHKRIRQLNTQDPVWTVSLPHLVTQQLETCLNNLGLEQYHSLMSNVDLIIREQLTDFIPQEKLNILLAINR